MEIGRVKGRVILGEKGHMWDISHFSGAENAAGAYRPDGRYRANTYDDAESELLIYAGSMSRHHLVENKSY